MPEAYSADYAIWSRESPKEHDMEKSSDKRSWIIGGTTLIGIGVGFLFLHTSTLIFIASVLIGVGAGLVIAPLVPEGKEKNP